MPKAAAAAGGLEPEMAAWFLKQPEKIGKAHKRYLELFRLERVFFFSRQEDGVSVGESAEDAVAVACDKPIFESSNLRIFKSKNLIVSSFHHFRTLGLARQCEVAHPPAMCDVTRLYRDLGGNELPERAMKVFPPQLPPTPQKKNTPTE